MMSQETIEAALRSAGKPLDVEELLVRTGLSRHDLFERLVNLQACGVVRYREREPDAQHPASAPFWLRIYSLTRSQR